MHSFFKKVLFVSTLMVLATGCGSDKSKNTSGVDTSGTAFTSLSSSGLSVTSSQALQNLTAWYTSTTEGSFSENVIKKETRTIKIYSASGGCTEKPLVVFGINLGTTRVCNSSNAIQSQSSVDKNVTPIQNGASKASNARLVALFNGSLGTVLNVTESNGRYGMLYTIQVGTSAAQVTYVIDSGINSVFNPVYVMDSTTRTEETLISIL